MSSTDKLSLAKAYNFLESSTAVVNAALVLFPHVAILALMGAPGIWWAALAALVILMWGSRVELAKVRKALLLAALEPAPAKGTPDLSEGGGTSNDK